MEILPAIIPQSLAHLEAQLALVPFAPSIQIDVIDGVFAPQISWPYGTGAVAGAPSEIRPYAARHTLEIDLMVRAPEVHLDEWLAAGAARLVVHLESTERMSDILAHRREYGYELGIACDDDTPVTHLFPYVEEGVFVQCMGIDTVGAQGMPFDPQVLANIRILREAHPALTISVDGSVNEDTILLLVDAGATRLVAGSAIFNTENPQVAYERLQTLVAG